MKFVNQLDVMDCGPACLCMIANNYGKDFSLDFLRNHSYITREGVSMMGIIEAAKKIGFDTLSSRLTLDSLFLQSELFPCILHWNQNHFVVLKKMSQKAGMNYYYIADPSHGFIKLTEEKFAKSWLSSENQGVALFLSPSELFFENETIQAPKIKIRYLLSYLTPYIRQIIGMFLLLLVGSTLTLFFPILTEKLIDKGVNAKDMHVITIVLLAQLSLIFGNIVTSVIRNWIMLYVGANISITIISDFLRKILQLPIKFFDSKMIGDFNQRIHDNDRIEEFLSSQGLLTLFSIITFSVYFVVLCYYDLGILLLYLLLTIISLAWSLYWLRLRKSYDYIRFQQKSQNQDSLYEILNGVTELKLNQYEERKRMEWESIQHRIFKLNFKLLKLDQVQVSGFDFINQLKNIFVTYFAAVAVLKGNLTLGALLSISYMIGQMNAPLNQLISFFRSLQDAKLSLQRLNEVQDHAVEEQLNLIPLNLSLQGGIKLINVSFQYEGPNSLFVLKNINCFIEEGKILAIVGASGSGKSSLMKLLLKFYEPSAGKIFFNDDDITALSPKSIRQNCGVVLQDGFIFSDTIERNITTGHNEADYNRLMKAVKIANIKEFIESLPLSYDTKIGANGIGLSGGQIQRILIARAVYKDPHYIFFDEATSALDAENEKIIHENLATFFKGKTVIIIAHRLSTVKKADNIIVLEKGEIAEFGSHEILTNKKGKYFSLVKNQLELGT